jgi:hypothetical protein
MDAVCFGLVGWMMFWLLVLVLGLSDEEMRCRVSRGIEELWNFGFVGESSRREEKQII